MINIGNNIVAVIGAGPVGIAAAAHLLERGLQPLILEKGKSVGHAMLEWGHVQVFTPWEYITDKAVLSLLDKTSWQHPEAGHLPTGSEIVNEYLIPAATLTALKHNFIYDAEVVSISKLGLSKSSSHDRDNTPYTIHYKTSDGEQLVIQASAVIDASGTWFSPNPMGTNGLPVAGEEENADAITYGIPDVLGVEQEVYAGKRVLVLGGGHSAINTALDLLKLRDTTPDTKVYWGVRRNNLERLLGGGINDKLPARGALGMAAKKAIEDGALELMAPFRVDKIQKTETGLQIHGYIEDESTDFEVDRIIVATGFRPDLHMLREIRLDIDHTVEAPTTLAPLIDPNLHSCGTVPPHGIDELAHPDKNFFVVGMKSYGRAPTFLMLTGYEQVRSIADELAGNHEAARQIELVLPETGVCNSNLGAASSSESKQEATVAAACCGPALDKTVAPATRVAYSESQDTPAAEAAATNTSCCDPATRRSNEDDESTPCCEPSEELVLALSEEEEPVRARNSCC